MRTHESSWILKIPRLQGQRLWRPSAALDFRASSSTSIITRDWMYIQMHPRCVSMHDPQIFKLRNPSPAWWGDAETSLRADLGAPPDEAGWSIIPMNQPGALSRIPWINADTGACIRQVVDLHSHTHALSRSLYLDVFCLHQ